MVTILIMVGIFGLLYFLMIRPQRKKMQQQQNLLRNLEVGDDVLTAGGIYGRISEFDEGSVVLEVADDNYLKITRDSVAQKISYGEPNEKNGKGSAKGIESENPSDRETAEEAEEASENE